jgi:hypothetical protein
MSKLILVRNRNNGSTGYTIPEKNLWRSFAPGETKQIPLEELQELQYQPGGDYMLKNLLIIEDQDALNVLNMQVEPEYNYTENDIRNILLNGTLDQLRDFLDFAPAGGIEICKDIAVKEEIPDVRKREIISQATGFDINSAIMVNKVMDAEDEKPQEQKKERRTAVAEGTKQRRVAVPETSSSAEEKPTAAKYKILSK